MTVTTSNQIFIRSWLSTVLPGWKRMWNPSFILVLKPMVRRLWMRMELIPLSDILTIFGQSFMTLSDDWQMRPDRKTLVTVRIKRFFKLIGLNNFCPFSHFGRKCSFALSFRWYSSWKIWSSTFSRCRWVNGAGDGRKDSWYNVCRAGFVCTVS